MAVNVTRMVSVDDLVFGENVRSPECMAIPAMVESLRRDGFIQEHPLVISEKSDGRLLVLCGNRRALALHWLRDSDAAAYNAAVTAGKVPAMVLKGLTEEEEVLRRIDHTPSQDRVPLDEWSTYLAIKQLVSVGLDTQERVAEKMGILYTKGKNAGQPNRSYVQVRMNLCRLPQKVEDEMRKYTLDPDSTAMRWSHIALLYRTYNAEFVDYPDSDGPQYTAAWAKVLTPVERKSPKAAGEKAALTPTDAVRRSQVASSRNLARSLLVVTGQSDDSLADLDRAMCEGETAVILLGQIEAYLGPDDYPILLEAAKDKAAEKVALTSVEEPAEEAFA